MRVLIVDDSKMMRLMHARSLRQLGYQATIVEAGSGEEALQVFDPTQLDLVIMDWNMPGMDGVACAQAVREREQATGQRRVPILMITSQSTEEQISRAEQAGIDLLLTKPVNEMALGDAVQALLAPGR